MTRVAPLLAAVEAGGTKFVCAVGDARGGSVETLRIPTRQPAETLAEVEAFFAGAAQRHGPLAAVGIGSFGPLDLDPRSPGYGRVSATPKPGWSGYDLLGHLASALDLPAAIDTDVNAAALAEATVGAASGERTVAYVTIGTGIGVGIATDGSVRHAGGHPEMGHIIPRRHPGHAGFPGVCPFHGDCLEGLASGPAIMAAWGESLETLDPDHPAWEIQSDYIGQLCANLVLTYAPDRIVLGGGVMGQSRLLGAARERTRHWLGGYVVGLNAPGALDRLITAPGCREASGLVGAYLLAEGARG